MDRELDPLTGAERAAVEEILRWRAGLTLAEVGEREGISRERVRQLQNQALAKMRQRMAITEGNCMRIHAQRKELTRA